MDWNIRMLDGGFCTSGDAGYPVHDKPFRKTKEKDESTKLIVARLEGPMNGSLGSVSAGRHYGVCWSSTSAWRSPLKIQPPCLFQKGMPEVIHVNLRLFAFPA